MADLLKIKDVHSSIRYIDDGQIPESNLKKEYIIISRGTKKGKTTTATTIINYTRMKKPKNPFKLRVVAESRKSGKRQIRKRDYTYTSTLNKAVQDAEGKRLLLLQEVEVIVELPKEVAEMPTFKDALVQQLEHRENEYKAENRPHNDKNIRQFAEKWLKPINEKKLDKITKADLTAIMAKMNKPDGTPLALRTKRTVYQIVNPVYTWLNEETPFKVDSPAHIKKLKKPDNERTCPFSVEEEEGGIDQLRLQFRKLYYYSLDRTGSRSHDQMRGVYIWLMHGRRLNEVLSLKWEHIDLDKKTYKIVMESNKARKDMEYVLTEYQIEAIGKPKKKGWVFPSVNDTKKALSKETIRNHDIGLFEEGMHKHDLRHCIGGYLINKGTLKEVIGVILGHTQNNSITDRYAKVQKRTANKAILSMLDDLLGIQLSKNEMLSKRSNHE